MTSTNTYVPTFVPEDLKWYERDGLMTWYNQGKCRDFLDKLDKHFENAKIANFDIINKFVRGQEMRQLTLQNYQTIQNKEVFQYLSKEREKIMSATIKSTVKRNDVFISEDLFKDHLTSPINGKNVFLSSIKKKKIWQKEKQAFIWTENILKMERRARIQKDIDYFVEKYSLIELFHGIGMNYLQFGSCSDLHKKSFEYYIYCYSEACYQKWNQRFTDFLFLKDSFKKN